MTVGEKIKQLLKKTGLSAECHPNEPAKLLNLAGFFMSVKEIVKETGLEMGDEKNPKPYKLAKLRKYKDRWIILFSAFDNKTKSVRQKQLRVPAKMSPQQKAAWAKERIEGINKLLALGYTLNPDKKEKEEKATPAPKSDRLSVKKAFSEMLALIEASFRAETLKSYKNCFKSFLAFASLNKLDKMPVDELEPRHIIAYLDGLALAGKSAYTFNGHLNMLRATANRLVERGHCAQDFTKGIKRKKEEAAENMPFSHDELATLEQCMLASNRPLWLACKIIYYAFIRPIELTRLKVGDIDLAAKHIKCSASTSKNKKLEYVPISKQLMKAFELYALEQYPADFYLFGHGRQFTPGPKPTRRSRLSDTHLEIMKSCNLAGSGKSLYTWKDTGAVNAYKAGIDIKTLQSLLRHSSVAMTEIYLASLGLMVKDNIEGKEW